MAQHCNALCVSFVCLVFATALCIRQNLNEETSTIQQDSAAALNDAQVSTGLPPLHLVRDRIKINDKTVSILDKWADAYMQRADAKDNRKTDRAIFFDCGSSGPKLTVYKRDKGVLVEDCALSDALKELGARDATTTGGVAAYATAIKNLIVALLSLHGKLSDNPLEESLENFIANIKAGVLPIRGGLTGHLRTEYAEAGSEAQDQMLEDLLTLIPKGFNATECEEMENLPNCQMRKVNFQLEVIKAVDEGFLQAVSFFNIHGDGNAEALRAVFGGITGESTPWRQVGKNKIHLASNWFVANMGGESTQVYYAVNAAEGGSNGFMSMSMPFGGKTKGVIQGLQASVDYFKNFVENTEGGIFLGNTVSQAVKAYRAPENAQQSSKNSLEVVGEESLWNTEGMPAMKPALQAFLEMLQ